MEEGAGDSLGNRDSFHCKQMCRHSNIVVWFILLASHTFASVPVWAENRQFIGVGTASLSNVSWEEAGVMAKESARRDAVEQAGLEVSSITLRMTGESSDQEVYDLFRRFTQSTSKGRIISEEVLHDSTFHSTDGAPSRRITIRATVVTESAQSDPSFQINVKLNQSTFANGDAMEIEVFATRDCYVTVLNLYQNDSLRVVFPNPMSPPNHLPAHETLIIPPENSGWELTVSGDAGRDMTEEAILVVATREPVVFRTFASDKSGGLVSFDDALVEINRWLMDIPSSNRATELAIYRVVQ